MDEHTDSALHYGDIGRPIYLPNSKSWTFSRSLAQAPGVYYTGQSRVVVQAPLTVSQPVLFGPYGQPPQSNSIPHALPDLGAHWSSIREHGLSNAITSTNEAWDQHVSTLLDLGYALNLGHGDSPRVSIAAVVTGECRNIISFRVLINETAELPLDGINAQMPSIGEMEKTEWSTQGAQIRQICFSHSAADDEHDGSWMAARLSESTTVFEPLYQKDPVPLHLHHDDPAMLPLPMRTSRLDANPVVEVSSALTGGFPHASVAFNPWYPKQMAIVDTKGNWSLWEIQSRHKGRKGNGVAIPGHRGSLPSVEKDDARRVRHDGWGSVQWIADFATILVADRRCVMVFRMEGDVVRCRPVELKLGRQSEWILEVRRNTQNADQFFVLTTTRLLLFDMSTASEDDEGSRLPLQHSLAWRHFRDGEDTTLQLSELYMRDHIYIILYSRFNQLVQAYPCPVVRGADTKSIVVPEPFLLQMPPLDENQAPEKPTHYSNFLFREVSFIPDPETTQRALNVRLIKLFWMDSSLAVHETLFKSPVPPSREEDIDTAIGDEIQGPKVLSLSVHQSTIPTWDDDDDDFVVEDRHEYVMPPRAISQPNFPVSTFEDLNWTLNWSPVYKIAVGNLPRIPGQVDPEELRPTLDKIRGELEDATLADMVLWQNSQTLLEISGRPESNDIDETAQGIEDLVSTALSGNPETQSQFQFMLVPIRFSKVFPGMPSVLQKTQLGLNFLETYDGLADECLPRLTQDIPLQTRRTKERIVRGVALDIVLARLIRTSNHTPRTPSQYVDSGTPTEDAPVQTPEQPDIAPTSSQIPSSQSTITGNHRGQFSSARRGEDSAPAFSSLAAFTTFKEYRSLPRSVANLLSHWQPGVDPSTYDWQKSSQAQGADSSQMGPGTPQGRARKSKRRSQQTPTLDRRTSLPPTPVAPLFRAWGSQPDHTLPLASSQPTLDEAPMTQTERGQFGAREVTKSNKQKKKRRAGGF